MNTTYNKLQHTTYNMNTYNIQVQHAIQLQGVPSCSGLMTKVTLGKC